MCQKYSGGVLGEPNTAGECDEELISLCVETPKKVEAKMNNLRVADAIDEIFTLLRRANKYIDETQPWILGRDAAQKARLDTVLYNLLEVIRFSATLLFPFLPGTAKKIFEQLAIEPSTWESLESFGGLKPGHKLSQPEILFARIDMKQKLEELEAKANAVSEAKLEAKAEEKTEPKAPEISIDDFAKTELRVAKIFGRAGSKVGQLLKLRSSWRREAPGRLRHKQVV